MNWCSFLTDQIIPSQKIIFAISSAGINRHSCSILPDSIAYDPGNASCPIKVYMFNSAKDCRL